MVADEKNLDVRPPGKLFFHGLHDRRPVLPRRPEVLEGPHVPPKHCLLLHEKDLHTHRGQEKGSAQAGDTASYDEGRLGDVHPLLFEGDIVGSGREAGQDELPRLLRVARDIVPHPGAVLPYADPSEQEGVEVRLLQEVLEKLLVERWGAGGDDHAVEAVLFDALGDHVLTRLRADKGVILCHGHGRIFLEIGAQVLHIDGVLDIVAAVADEDARFHRLRYSMHLDAASPPEATVSGTSLGPEAMPQTKMPSTFVSEGAVVGPPLTNP